MRYRPFGVNGKAVSAASLVLSEEVRSQPVAAWKSLVIAALECGINAFEVTDKSPNAAEGLRQAVESVERRLIFLTWKICGDPRTPLDGRRLQESVRRGLQGVGVEYFDLLSIDETAYATLAPEAARLLDDLRRTDIAWALGIAGGGELVDKALATGAFDALTSPYNLATGWAIRRRIREASHSNIAVLGAEAFPPDLCRLPSQVTGRPSLFRRPGPTTSSIGAYTFLHETRGWEADELCLAYAMTEPALASVQIEASRPEVIERLSLVPDRDLPTGLAAQIEMARIDHENRAPGG